MSKRDKYNLRNGLFRAPRTIGDKTIFAYWLRIGEHEVGVDCPELADRLVAPTYDNTKRTRNSGKSG